MRGERAEEEREKPPENHQRTIREPTKTFRDHQRTTREPSETNREPSEPSREHQKTIWNHQKPPQNHQKSSENQQKLSETSRELPENIRKPSQAPNWAWYFSLSSVFCLYIKNKGWDGDADACWDFHSDHRHALISALPKKNLSKPRLVQNPADDEDQSSNMTPGSKMAAWLPGASGLSSASLIGSGIFEGSSAWLRSTAAFWPFQKFSNTHFHCYGPS